MKHRPVMRGTGEFMKLWDYRSTHKCPRCGNHCETAAHVTMCTAPSGVQKWKISLETLGKDLAKRHTHPGLTRFLLSRILEWKTRTTRKAIRPMEHDLRLLEDAQYEIGWDKFVFGNISVLWKEIQAQYFQEIGKQNSGLRCTSALIQIWQVAWYKWEHMNAILHNSNNLVTQEEAAMIASQVQMELETGTKGLLQGDRYLFDDHRVTKSAKWTVESQVSWLETVSEARQAYTISLTWLLQLFEGRSLMTTHRTTPFGLRPSGQRRT
jgi:hypothetical protein